MCDGCLQNRHLIVDKECVFLYCNGHSRNPCCQFGCFSSGSKKDNKTSSRNKQISEMISSVLEDRWVITYPEDEPDFDERNQDEFLFYVRWAEGTEPTYQVQSRVLHRIQCLHEENAKALLFIYRDSLSEEEIQRRLNAARVQHADSCGEGEVFNPGSDWGRWVITTPAVYNRDLDLEHNNRLEISWRHRNEEGNCNQEYFRDEIDYANGYGHPRKLFFYGRAAEITEEDRLQEREDFEQWRIRSLERHERQKLEYRNRFMQFPYQEISYRWLPIFNPEETNEEERQINQISIIQHVQDEQNDSGNETDKPQHEEW